MGTTAGGSSWTQLWGARGSQDVAVGCCKEQGVCPWAAHPCGRTIAMAAELLLPFLLLQTNAFFLPASYQPRAPAPSAPFFFFPSAPPASSACIPFWLSAVLPALPQNGAWPQQAEVPEPAPHTLLVWAQDVSKLSHFYFYPHCHPALRGRSILPPLLFSLPKWDIVSSFFDSKAKTVIGNCSADVLQYEPRKKKIIKKFSDFA